MCPILDRRVVLVYRGVARLQTDDFVSDLCMCRSRLREQCSSCSQGYTGRLITRRSPHIQTHLSRPVPSNHGFFRLRMKAVMPSIRPNRAAAAAQARARLIYSTSRSMPHGPKLGIAEAMRGCVKFQTMNCANSVNPQWPGPTKQPNSRKQQKWLRRPPGRLSFKRSRRSGDWRSCGVKGRRRSGDLCWCSSKRRRLKRGGDSRRRTRKKAQAQRRHTHRRSGDTRRHKRGRRPRSRPGHNNEGGSPRPLHLWRPSFGRPICLLMAPHTRLLSRYRHLHPTLGRTRSRRHICSCDPGPFVRWCTYFWVRYRRFQAQKLCLDRA